jgi:CheY-like chemotaxis protein
MPGIDGYELIRRLRTSGSTTPAIAVTAFAHPDDRDEALAAGYDFYCAKPIDADRLLEAVRHVMMPR